VAIWARRRAWALGQAVMLRQAAEAERKRPRQELETDTPAQQAHNGAGFYGWPCGAEGQCHHRSILRT
jgi:hypothetical protein